ncbi:hypothetical protein FAK_07290 [Desulfoferula mesophila]|uniref:DUF2029 domain-containing protein n=1 Tax=Desulfoferula mesophila TaxID=3058419 RepID=A0AAU9EV77_9BACT|nr:hypothetical protein FAK_07290 [Desulfoferula mesophilus]
MVFTNFVYGQNGYLSAALFAGGLLMLPRNSAIAGLLLVTLAYKPQLAFLVPLALLAGQNFKALAWWLAGLAGWILLSLMILGWASWQGFFEGIYYATNAIEAGAAKLPQMSTVSSAVLLAGGEPWLARVAQSVMMLLGAAVVVGVWRRREIPDDLKNAVLMVASILIAPHAFRYDLVLLIPALAWLCLAGLHTGWLPGEKIIYLIAISLSFFTTAVNELIHFTLDPIVIAIVLGYALYRCRLWAGGQEAQYSSARNIVR